MPKIKTYGDIKKGLRLPMEELPNIPEGPEKEECQRLLEPVRDGLASLIEPGKRLPEDTKLPKTLRDAYEEFDATYNKYFG